MKHCPAIKKLALLTFVFVVFVHPQKTSAQSGALFQVTDVVNTDTASVMAQHEVGFIIPNSSLQVGPTDYINVNLDNFSNVTVPLLLIGSYTGTPVYSVDGTTAQITGVTVLPGTTLTISGITAINPVSTDDFDFSVSITQDQAGTLIKNFGTGVATLNPGTVTVSAEVIQPTARLEIQGFSAPGTYIIFTSGGSTQGTDVANGIGYFNKIFPALTPGSQTVNLYGIDTDNRSTAIQTVTVNAPVYQTTTVSNLLLSPTMQISSTSILQGEDLYATGSAYPGTTVTVFTDTPLRTYTASASAAGAWTYTIDDTSNYNPGDYRIYSLAQTGGGLQSLTSPSLIFTVTTDSSSSGTPCGDIDEGDLNCDDIINLTDFSILMYYWGTADATADMNSDGVVDLIDFSIMMYYWGT